jgi:hypothetical protein
MQEEIQKFLVRTKGSREACLMIAENSEMVAELEKAAVDFGFKKSKNIREIFNAIRDGEKSYFILEDALGNNLYNILAQYPTGQVNSYDGQKNLVANPDYQNGSILILITKKNLEKIEQSEKSLFKLAGLAWQK